LTDTTQNVEALYRRLILSQSPAKRLAMACSMFATAKALVLAGIAKAEQKDTNPKALRRHLFLRLYGGDFNRAQKEKILEHLQAT
jgi:hypothetical protein